MVGGKLSFWRRACRNRLQIVIIQLSIANLVEPGLDLCDRGGLAGGSGEFGGMVGDDHRLIGAVRLDVGISQFDVGREIIGFELEHFLEHRNRVAVSLQLQ